MRGHDPARTRLRVRVLPRLRPRDSRVGLRSESFHGPRHAVEILALHPSVELQDGNPKAGLPQLFESSCRDGLMS
jgi:hypothetical protein